MRSETKPLVNPVSKAETGFFARLCLLFRDRWLFSERQTASQAQHIESIDQLRTPRRVLYNRHSCVVSRLLLPSEAHPC